MNKEIEAILIEIDKKLALKNHNPLTNEEKEILLQNWAKAYLVWKNTPKATNHEFALKTQLDILFSNLTYDVLRKTRNYV